MKDASIHRTWSVSWRTCRHEQRYDPSTSCPHGGLDTFSTIVLWSSQRQKCSTHTPSLICVFCAAEQTGNHKENHGSHVLLTFNIYSVDRVTALLSIQHETANQTHENTANIHIKHQQVSDRADALREADRGNTSSHFTPSDENRFVYRKTVLTAQFDSRWGNMTILHTVSTANQWRAPPVCVSAITQES